MSMSKKIVLTSSDGEIFEVEEAVALQSQTIAHLIEDGCVDGIPLPDITGKILAKVIEYCKKHVVGDSTSSSEEELKNWDADFMDMDKSTLFNLIFAANYLNVYNLFDLACQTVADMIKGKTPEEIGTFLNIKSDFTPEEEAKLRDENQWFLNGNWKLV